MFLSALLLGLSSSIGCQAYTSPQERRIEQLERKAVDQGRKDGLKDRGYLNTRLKLAKELETAEQKGIRLGSPYYMLERVSPGYSRNAYLQYQSVYQLGMAAHGTDNNSVSKACVKKLVEYGKKAEPHAERYISEAEQEMDPSAKQSTYGNAAASYERVAYAQSVAKDPQWTKTAMTLANCHANASAFSYEKAGNLYASIIKKESAKGIPDQSVIELCKSSLKQLALKAEQAAIDRREKLGAKYSMSMWKVAENAWMVSEGPDSVNIQRCKDGWGEADREQRKADREQRNMEARLMRYESEARARKAKQEQADAPAKAKRLEEENRKLKEQLKKTEADREAAEKRQNSAKSQVQKQKPKDLCSYCDGTGHKGCWVCQATGRSRDHNGRDYGMCSVCSGRGYKACTACKGTGRR